ncbi:unnamed protein product, partial [Hymenolepis diminuta]
EEDETSFVDDDISIFDDINDEEEDEDDFIEDISALNYFGVSYSLNFLKRILSIDTIAIDHSRCCKAVFRVIKYVRTSKTRAFALRRLFNIFERMSEGELDEVGTNPSYMQSLIKSVAESHLPRYHMDTFLKQKNDDKFSYLRNFWELNRRDARILESIIKLLTNRPQACENFISVGGPEIGALILQ